MRANPPRTVGAAFLTCALLVAAAPAAAAPCHAAKEQSLLQAIEAWLTSWLPGAASGSVPEPILRASGFDPEPGGDPTSTEDDPLAQPQVGAEANPDG